MLCATELRDNEAGKRADNAEETEIRSNGVMKRADNAVQIKIHSIKLKKSLMQLN